MREARTSRFKRSYRKLPLPVRIAFAKQMQHLLTDLRHPSLRAKKYDETHNIWQARITHNVRIYFIIEGDVYWLIDIERHAD